VSMFSSVHATWRLCTCLNCVERFQSLKDVITGNQLTTVNSTYFATVWQPLEDTCSAMQDSVELTSRLVKTWQSQHRSLQTTVNDVF